MAHIEHRGPGKWRARHRGPDGKERSRTFATKRDAQRFLDTVQVAKARGVWVDPALGRQTFESYAHAWLRGRGHVAPGTRQKEVGHVENHLLPAFGGWQLVAIQPADIRAWLATLERSPGTVKAIFGTLRLILGTALRDGVLGRNPCDSVDQPRDPAGEEMLFLTPGETAQLASAIDGRYEALIYLAAYGGLRWGELAALRTEHLKLLRGTVDVRRSLADISGQLIIQPPKSGKPRTVTIPRTICDMVGSHIARYPSEDPGVVFSSPKGHLLRRSLWYRRHYKPAVAAAGLDPRLRFHDLRHTAAALAIAQGAHPKAIQERFGHSTARLTLDRYGHLFPTLDESLQDGLESSFLRAAAASSRPASPNVLLMGSNQRPG